MESKQLSAGALCQEGLHDRACTHRLIQEHPDAQLWDIEAGQGELVRLQVGHEGIEELPRALGHLCGLQQLRHHLMHIALQAHPAIHFPHMGVAPEEH